MLCNSCCQQNSAFWILLTDSNICFEVYFSPSSLPLPGRSPSGWSRREAASVPWGDAFNIQVNPHASGWWTLSFGSLAHSDLIKEPSQHGAEKQEENIYASAEWVSWICACPMPGSLFEPVYSVIDFACTGVAVHLKRKKRSITSPELFFYCIVINLLASSCSFTFWVLLCLAFRKVLYLSVIYLEMSV